MKDELSAIVSGLALAAFFAFSIWLLWYNAGNKDL